MQWADRPAQAQLDCWPSRAHTFRLYGRPPRCKGLWLKKRGLPTFCCCLAPSCHRPSMPSRVSARTTPCILQANSKLHPYLSRTAGRQNGGRPALQGVLRWLARAGRRLDCSLRLHGYIWADPCQVYAARLPPIQFPPCRHLLSHRPPPAWSGPSLEAPPNACFIVSISFAPSLEVFQSPMRVRLPLAIRLRAVACSPGS